MTQQQAVAAFVTNTKFEGYLLVRMSEQRVSANGSKYLDMTLCDRTGDVNAKMWDGNVPPPKTGSVIKVRATIIEYNGRLQMRVEKLRAQEEADDVDLSLLTPCAPYPAKDMLAKVNATVAQMENPELKAIIEELLKNAGDKLLYYPAASRLHHAERSGLLHHTSTMLKAADALLPVYPQLNGDLVRAGVIAHDLQKIDELDSDETGNVTDYTREGQLLGHLVTGVSQVRQAAQKLGITSECVLLLSHMIISHHGEAEYGSPKPPMFPEAEMLHTLDLLDARMNEMQGVLRRTPPGAFSEKIWSLERRVYHPMLGQESEQALVPEEKASPEKPVSGSPRRDADKAYSGLL